MSVFDEKHLSLILQDEFTPRSVEPGIFSVMPTDDTGNEYDGQLFGFAYDLVACNPVYNRLVWGYSVKVFKKIASDALQSSSEGCVLDLACGTLAFTEKIYGQYYDRPVVLLDRSLKMLRMAKSRFIKQFGKVPDNMVFLHSDALHLPFKRNAFTTILSENLLHCLDDTLPLLMSLKDVAAPNGQLYFTTLIKSNRWADKYLDGLAASGKLVSRKANDHKEKFVEAGFMATYETAGNLLLIKCENRETRE